MTLHTCSLYGTIFLTNGSPKQKNKYNNNSTIFILNFIRFADLLILGLPVWELFIIFLFFENFSYNLIFLTTHSRFSFQLYIKLYLSRLYCINPGTFNTVNDSSECLVRVFVHVVNKLLGSL